MRPHNLILASLLVLSSSQSAFALSCTSDGWDIAKTYDAHAQSEYRIMFVTGRFHGEIPNRSGNALDKKTMTYPLAFKGKSIGKSGLKPLQRKVTIVDTCFASWCGGGPQINQELIAAIKLEENGSLTLTSTPCSPNRFKHTGQNIELIQVCMKNGTCTPKNFQ